MASSLIQWLLILHVVMPAIAVTILGPSWLFDVAFGDGTTMDHRLWFIVLE